jgi:hypothetical protein
MAQDKFTEEEYQNLKEQMKRVGSHLPLDITSLIWRSYERIKGVREAQPCNCPSSGNLWIKAVNVVNEYIKDNG